MFSTVSFEPQSPGFSSGIIGFSATDGVEIWPVYTNACAFGHADAIVVTNLTTFAKIRSIIEVNQRLRTATPGNSLPSIHSKKAPPAVEI